MLSAYSTGNPIVDASATLRISGNVIPHTWYKTIVKESGKPYLTAIVILADIVYWYRPTEVRDEGTGQVVALKKKFSADLLQRSYQQLSEEFGISKKEATNAIVFLEKTGVVKRVFRKLNRSGLTLSNVLFLELIVDRLRELTYPNEKEDSALVEGGGIPLKGERVSPEKERGISDKRGSFHSDVSIPFPSQGQTNTDITSEIITVNTSNPIQSYMETVKEFKQQIDYDAIMIDRPYDRDQLNELVMIALEVLTSNVETVRVNREDKPLTLVKNMYYKLDKFSVEYVLDSLRECETKAHNIRAVMLTALYNAPMTIGSYYTNRVSYHEATGVP